MKTTKKHENSNISCLSSLPSCLYEVMKASARCPGGPLWENIDNIKLVRRYDCTN